MKIFQTAYCCSIFIAILHSGITYSSFIVKSSAEQTEAERRFHLDENAKKKDVISLIDKGLEYIKNNTLTTATKMFTHSQEFVNGELFLFVMDEEGNVLAHGKEIDLVFKNLYELRDDFGSPIIQNMITIGRNGGGWLSYRWNGAVKKSYIKRFIFEEKAYIIGTGYYPHSKADILQVLVAGAAAFFNEILAANYPPSLAFAAYSYPLSQQFIRGDLVLTVIDFNGKIHAQRNHTGLIGTNDLNYKDVNGLFVNKEIINKLQKSDSGIWITYELNNSTNHTYAQKITDKQGTHYFISSGYYPQTGRDEVLELIKKGYQLMKTSGKSVAAQAFSDEKNDDFKNGDLYLVLYDANGVCIAHGNNRDLIGKNLLEEKDDDGKYYVKELIRTADQGDVWVNVRINNSFMSTYSQKINLGLEEFIIVSGVYPTSKLEVVELLVKSAVGLIETTPTKKAFYLFTDKNSSFIRGDLFIFVFDQDGLCYAYGDKHEYLLKNLIDLKDDTGKPFIKLMIDAVKQGPAHVTYKLNNHKAVAFVEQVQKEGKTFTVGCSFYL